MPTRLPQPFAQLFGRTDEQAMARLQSHDDEQALTRLAQRWQEPIRRLCTRMTGDEHLGEDLAQEAFTRVYLRRGDYRAGSRFSTWLWRIALNLCHDELRRRKRRSAALAGDPMTLEAVLEAAVDPDRPAPDEALGNLETAQLVRCALQRLAEPLRIVLILRHYEDLKYREIAEVLQIPEGTVKSRMTEALSQMERLLEPSLRPPGPIPGASNRQHPSPALPAQGRARTEPDLSGPSALARCVRLPGFPYLFGYL